MQMLIIVGSSILSVSTLAFLIHPTWSHGLSIATLFGCLVVMNIMHTIDERRKLASILKSRKFQVYEPSEIAKQFHTLPKGAYVYVIQDIDVTGYCKIGRTATVYKRIHDIGVKMPFRTQVVHVIRCEDMNAVETVLHRVFAEYRIDGEWFNLDIIAVEYLKTKESMP